MVEVEVRVVSNCRESRCAASVTRFGACVYFLPVVGQRTLVQAGDERHMRTQHAEALVQLHPAMGRGDYLCPQPSQLKHSRTCGGVEISRRPCGVRIPRDQNRFRRRRPALPLPLPRHCPGGWGDRARACNWRHTTAREEGGSCGGDRQREDLLLGHDATSPLPCSRVETASHMQWSRRKPLSMQMLPLHALEESNAQELVRLHQRYLHRANQSDKAAQKKCCGYGVRGRGRVGLGTNSEEAHA